MNDNLKPCPFCGTLGSLDFVNVVISHFDKDDDGYYTEFLYTAKCTYCHCRIGNYIDPKMAIDAWNSRYSDE